MNAYRWGLFTSCNSPIIENLIINGLSISGGETADIQTFVGAIVGETGSNEMVISNVHIVNYSVARENFHCLGIGGFIGKGSNITIRNSSISFAQGLRFESTSNRDIVGTSNAVLGGICAEGYENITVVNTTINLGNVIFSSTYPDINCYVGGLIGKRHGVLSLDNIIVSGHITISSAGNVYSGLIYNTEVTPTNSLSGVNASGLTINVE